jgi:Mpv17-like protein
MWWLKWSHSESVLIIMAAVARSIKRVFAARPLASNCVVYGTLYAGAEFSQQTLIRKILVRN